MYAMFGCGSLLHLRTMWFGIFPIEHCFHECNTKCSACLSQASGLPLQCTMAGTISKQLLSSQPSVKNFLARVLADLPHRSSGGLSPPSGRRVVQAALNTLSDYIARDVWLLLRADRSGRHWRPEPLNQYHQANPCPCFSGVHS